ncbi:hypothetical protein BGZ83_004480 [Gryganskiella cystojenkinii]|nr:hypothetical protein BGZ83_004480 [Gryganskiella cystojenkinii]
MPHSVQMRPAFVLVKCDLAPQSSAENTPTASICSPNGTISTPKLIVTFTDKNANDTLLEYPSGAYTATRTFDHHGILDFSGHVSRIANSLSQLRFATPHKENEIEAEEEESPQVVQALHRFRNAETLKPLMTDLVREGLRDYFGQVSEEFLLGEAKVTVLCSWDVTISCPIFIAHVEPLKAPKERRCKVRVHGSPRHHATAKDSQWVRDRSKLEADLSKDTNEGLLLDEKTQDLYEGLSSNFFVYDKKQRCIVTAPLDSVLQGTILKVVMAVCEQEQIPVQHQFPNLKNVQDWEGAFITSTSRLVLPIETMIMPDGSEVHFQESETIDLIRIRVLEECQKRVEQVL